MKKTKKSKLKLLRLTLGIITTFLLTLFFLDFSGFLPHNIHSIAHLQFVPAVLFGISGKIIYLIITLLLIVLFGRLYCSVICPLGVLQDFINWLSKKINKKKRFNYKKSFNILRYILLILAVISIIFGAGGILGVIDPYSMYGRILVHLFTPVVILVNNLLAMFSEWTENYYFMELEIPSISMISFIIAIISFITVALLSFTRGRKFCNLICPVGTSLYLLSKISLFKIRIDKEKCNSCGLCEMNCKSECINAKEKNIDIGNCVVCFNCINKCNKGGISYKFITKKSTSTVSKN